MTKERARLEQEQAQVKRQEELSAIYIPTIQQTAFQRCLPESKDGMSGPVDVRRFEDLRQVKVNEVGRDQHKEQQWKTKAGSAAGLESYSRSNPSELYDSDSEEELAEVKVNTHDRGAVSSSGQMTQNVENLEDGMNNLEVERQQIMILEKIKQEQENEKKSLELIAKLSLEDASGEIRGASADVRRRTVSAMQFQPSQFPGLEVKRSNTALSTSERIAALKAAAVAQGTYVDTGRQDFVSRSTFQETCIDRESDEREKRQRQENLQRREVEVKRLRNERMPSSESNEENPVKFKDWVVNDAPKRSSVEITNIAFKKKNLEKPKTKDEDKGRRSRCNSDTMAEMDAERKLHANIIKERAAAQAREKLANQREVVVAKEWEEASRRKELAEKAKLARTVSGVAGETPGSRRTLRDKSKDKQTKEQRSKRWSSVGHGAKAKPGNSRSRRTSGK